MTKPPRAFMPAYMDAPTLAYTLSLSVRTIDAWVERGLLPKPLEASGKRLWSWRAVEAAMERLCEDADREHDLEPMINPNARKRIAPGTFAQVIREYLMSDKFQRLAPSTQRGYRIYLTEAEQPELLGAIDVNDIATPHVQAFLDRYSDRSGAMGQSLTALKAVVKWGIRRGKLPPNVPVTYGCEVVKSDGGHVAWTEEQIALGEAHCHPQMARYIALQSGTGQRGSDLVKMQWSEIEERNGRLGIQVKQQKTFKKTKLVLWVPFTPALQAAIATWERPTAAEQVADPNKRFILLKKDGKPWTREQVTSCWAHFERHRHGELAALTLHGLRATAVIRLLRAGANPSQVAYCVGMTVPMVQRYARSAVQEEHAEAAISFLDARAARSHVKREAV
jgi:integrase